MRPLFVLLLVCVSGAICREQADFHHHDLLDIAIVGTGAAGAYSAFRLANWSPSPPKIAMFEALDHIGGRAHHINSDDVPQLGDLEINLGAYRFNEIEHVFITALHHDVLNIPTRCYHVNNVLGMTENCPGGPTKFMFTRGQLLSPAEQGDSDNFPYNLEGLEWHPPNGKPSIDGAAFNRAFPFANPTYFPDLTNPDDTKRWAAVKEVLTRIQNCGNNPHAHNIPDCDIPGDNPARISLGDLVRGVFPEEFIRLNDAISGNYLPRSRHLSNMYNSGINRVTIAYGTGGGAYRVVQEGGGRHGYTEAPFRMIRNASQVLGVPMNRFVNFGHQLHTIRKEDDNYRLFFANGRTALARNVILNTPYNQFRRVLDTTNNLLFDNPPAVTQKLYGFGQNLKLSGTYLHYNDAWWVRQGFFDTRIVTEEILKDMRTYHGHTICEDEDFQNCHGLLFVAYQIQQVNVLNGIDDERAGPNKASNFYTLDSNDPRDQHILNTLHETVKRVIGDIPGLDVSDIPLPDYGVHANWATDPWWEAGGVLPGVNEVPPGLFEKTAMNPIPGERVYMANLDWMVNHAGDAEAAYIMAEKVANRFFGLARPDFLSEPWYDANVMFDT